MEPFNTPLKIREISLPHRAVFGPMAGFTDAPARRLMAQHGAGFTVSEMVSSRALVYGDHKTVSLLKAEPNGAPYGVQIFGEVPEIMGQAAAAVEQYAFDFLDINMGCPAPKIVSGGAGSKLMLAIVLNGIFGALMTLGCGLYAPCMVMVFMLGLNPFVAFPIMMGSAAALMPVAGRAFIKAGSYERKISLCFTLSGIVAVLIATNFVLNMDVHLLAWGIIVVVLYTSISYVRKGLKKRVPAAEASGLVSKKAL